MNFNTKSVSKITGLSIRQIDYWDRTKFIKPSVRGASGYGSMRRYSFNDLVQMKVARTLLDKGISLQKIRKSITYLKNNMPEVSKPLSELKFLTDGESIFVITNKDREIIDTLKNGQIVFSIALGEIVETLKGEIIEFQKENKHIVIVKSISYEVLLHPDTEDGGFWIECPSLHGCASQGDTEEEALEMIKDAIEGHLEVLKKQEKFLWAG